MQPRVTALYVAVPQSGRWGESALSASAAARVGLAVTAVRFSFVGDRSFPEWRSREREPAARQLRSPV